MTTENIEIIGDNEPSSPAVFYKNFKDKLIDNHRFPCRYVYKFIVASSPEKIALIHALFENTDASFATRDSKNGKYVSLTVSFTAKDADEVIRYYQEVASIDGVLML